MKRFNLGMMAILTIITTSSAYAEKNKQWREELRIKCEAGDGVDCHAAAQLARNDKDYKKERTYHEKGCKLGNMKSCDGLASALFNGSGGPKDIKMAASLFEKACHLKEVPRACSLIASLYYEGKVVDQNLPKARKYYNSACKEAPSACGELGKMLIRAEGGEQDIAHGLRLLSRACQAEIYLSFCEELGDLYNNGDYISIDKAKAEAVYSEHCLKRNSGGSTCQKACKLGNKKSCDLYNKAFDEDFDDY